VFEVFALEGVDLDVEVAVGVYDDRDFAADLDFDVEFLADFAVQGGFERLGQPDLPAGESPEAAEKAVGLALVDQNLAGPEVPP